MSHTPEQSLAEAKPMYESACPGIVGYADAAPELALRFRALMEEAMAPVQVEQLQPMWA